MRPLRPDPEKDPTLLFETAQCESADVPYVIGVDEVGRGAIAGPVAVGVHAVPRGTTAFPAGLRDSKLLSEQRRTALAPALDDWGLGAVAYGSAEEIDREGITVMLGIAARRALLLLREQGIPVEDSLVLLDGAHDWLSPVLRTPLRVVTAVGADRSSASVAAASVRAKVTRDAAMREAHDTHPAYAWDRNKGYGSSAHYSAIREHGLTPLHRRTWIRSLG